MAEEQNKDIHQINFAVNAYKSQSRLLSSERVLNYYAEPTPTDSPFKAAAIFGTPGTSLWVQFNVFNPVYGLQVMGANLYAVIGLSLYKINPNKTADLVGTLGTTPGPVLMTENGVQLTILTQSGTSYYYNANTEVFGEITSINYQSASSVTTLDGYTIFSVQESGQFFISALRDTTTYSALDFATAEALSDNIVRIITYNRQLYIFGTNTVEVWYDTGNVTFPFQRMDGVLVERGLGAKLSVAIEVDGFYWLGEDKIIYSTGTYLPKKISTFAIDNEISTYSRTEDAVGFIYTQKGHKFYCLTFPSVNKTWVYDISTELWHERGSLNMAQTEVVEWACQYHASFNGLNIVNGRQAGKLYFLDTEKYSEDGIPIISQAISCTQFDNYNEKTIDKLALMLEFGVGIDGSGQGINPKLMMQYSTDGGYTWSDETTEEIGTIGSYQQEVFWDRLGLCRSIIFKVTTSDPVRRGILGGYIKTKSGAF